jgi:hypothetical protein
MELYILDDVGEVIKQNTRVMSREDIVRGMTGSTKPTHRYMKQWFGKQTLPSANADRMVKMLQNKGFTAESGKELMVFVKKFYKEAPEDFVDFLNFITIHGDDTSMRIKEGIGAFYRPGERSLNYPAVARPTTAGHEVKHALWDWVRTRMAENPDWGRRFPKLQSFMSKAEWEAPALRRKWFGMAEDMKSLERKGIISFKEHFDAYRRFQAYYRKGIPEEMMANTFSRAWLKEGMSMQDAMKESMKLGGRLIEQQKPYRHAMVRDFNAWKKGITRVSDAEIEAVNVHNILEMRKAEAKAKASMKRLGIKTPMETQLQERIGELRQVREARARAKEAMNEAVGIKPAISGPRPTHDPLGQRVKGALGREKLEKQLGDMLWKRGYPKEVIANVQSSMMHSTVDDLQGMIDKLKGGKTSYKAHKNLMARDRMQKIKKDIKRGHLVKKKGKWVRRR